MMMWFWFVLTFFSCSEDTLENCGTTLRIGAQNRYDLTLSFNFYKGKGVRRSLKTESRSPISNVCSVNEALAKYAFPSDL